MKTCLLLIVVYFVYCEGAVVVRNEPSIVNERPIIGVLSQEPFYYLHTKFIKENYTSYIAASYVKALESAGARVVPIMIGRGRSYYREIMNKLNGVLFPGGPADFNSSNGYADAGQHIYEIAMDLNEAGNYFPIFGTCLGFELLTVLASGRWKEEIRVRCHSYVNAALHFPTDYRSSKMYMEAPEEVTDILANEKVTANQHGFCVVDENLRSHNLTNDWRATSYAYDEKGLKFVASIEHKRYPFYGAQFHPEKPVFEWKASKRFNHSFKSLKANRWFMDFFVNECRKNSHSFRDQAEENHYLIYNYKPTFTGVLGSAFQQCYFFESRGPISSLINNTI